jgi:hypothetical protein
LFWWINAFTTKKYFQNYQCKILDCTHLVLWYFCNNENLLCAYPSRTGTMYFYILPRFYQDLDSLRASKGGIGMCGPGETEIETDRRLGKWPYCLKTKSKQLTNKWRATQQSGEPWFVLHCWIYKCWEIYFGNARQKGCFCRKQNLCNARYHCRKVVIKNPLS